MVNFPAIFLLLSSLLSVATAATGKCNRHQNEKHLNWHFDMRRGHCYSAIQLSGAADFSEARQLCSSYNSTLITVPNVATNALLVSQTFLPNRRMPALVMIGLRFRNGQGTWDDNTFFDYPDRFEAFSNLSLQQSANRVNDGDFCTVVVFDAASTASSGRWARVACDMPLPQPVAMCSRLADESDVCPPGTMRRRSERRCEVCPVNTFQSSFNQDWCRPCPGPAMAGYFIDTKMPGATSQMQCYRPRPVIIDYNPKFGIKKGGTIVEVTGRNFFNSSEFLVLFNNKIGKLLQWSSNRMLIETPEFNETGPVVVHMPNSTKVIATFQLLFTQDIFFVKYFTYGPDPIVTHYTPHNFIAGGSQNLTLHGENLDSAASSNLTITMTDSDGKTVKIDAVCIPVNSSQMQCQLPDLSSQLASSRQNQPDASRALTTVSNVVARSGRRRRRQRRKFKRNNPEMTNDCRAIVGGSSSSSRQLSSSDSTTSSTPSWTTSLTLSFSPNYQVDVPSLSADGNDRTLGQGEGIVIYEDPIINVWSDDQLVNTSSIVSNASLVTIEGTGLKCGLSTEDYRISIRSRGQEVGCEIIQLTMTTLTCRPLLNHQSSRSRVVMPVQLRVGGKKPISIGNLVRIPDPEPTRPSTTTTTTSTSSTTPSTTTSTSTSTSITTLTTTTESRTETTAGGSQTSGSTARLATEGGSGDGTPYIRDTTMFISTNPPTRPPGLNLEGTTPDAGETPAPEGSETTAIKPTTTDQITEVTELFSSGFTDAPATEPPPTRPPMHRANKDNVKTNKFKLLLSVGIGVGLALLIILITLIVVCVLWRKQKQAASEVAKPHQAALMTPVSSAQQTPHHEAPRHSIRNEGLSQHGSMEVDEGFISVPVLTNATGDSADDANLQQIASGHEARAIIADLPEPLQVKVTTLLINSGRIKVTSTFLRGNFGELAFGYWAPSLDRSTQAEPVLVKSLNRFMQRSTVVKKFLENALLLYRCDHENVLAPVAVAFRRARPIVLYPHTDAVNLKIYLTDPSLTILVRQLVDIACQVASAMVYLTETSGYGIIHKDIACRNCMLAPDDNFLLKLTDSALVGDMHGLDYEYVDEAHDFMPVRWMAPESLLALEFTPKSDVWSFGVLIWELFTRGGKPFHDIHSVDLVTDLRGRAVSWLARTSDESPMTQTPVFTQPRQMPGDINEILNKCCQARSNVRPTFSLLNESLTSLLDKNETLPAYNRAVSLEEASK